MSKPDMRKKPSHHSPAHNFHPRDTDIKRSAAEAQVTRCLIQPAPMERIRWETITQRVGTPSASTTSFLHACRCYRGAVEACQGIANQRLCHFLLASPIPDCWERYSEQINADVRTSQQIWTRLFPHAYK